jgi:hypothetical protein
MKPIDREPYLVGSQLGGKIKVFSSRAESAYLRLFPFAELNDGNSLRGLQPMLSSCSTVTNACTQFAYS